MILAKLFRKRVSSSRELKLNSTRTTLLRELYRGGSYNAVLAGCNQALIIDLTNSELYLIRGLAKYRLGDLTGAGQDMKQAAHLSQK